MVNQKPQTTNDARNLMLGITSVISLVGFFMWITYVGINERYAIKEENKLEISQLQERHEAELRRISGLLDKMGTTLELIAERQHFLFDNMWTKGNQLLWCYEVQKRSSGFTCPDYSTLKDLGLLGTYEQRLHENKQQPKYHNGDQPDYVRPPKTQ